MRREWQIRLLRTARDIVNAFTVVAVLLMILSVLANAGLLKPETAPSWAMVLMTFPLAYYASAAYEEAKNDRKKDRVEKTLEYVYSPLYQILRQGKAREKNGTEISTPKEDYSADLPPSRLKITMGEYMQILDILTRFGHLMLEPEYRLLSVWTETSIFDHATKSHYLEDKEMGKTLWDSIVQHRANLRKELDKLTGTWPF